MLYVVTRLFSSVLNVTTLVSLFAQRRVVDGILILFPVALAITVVIQIFRRDDTARYWLLGEGVCYVLSTVYQLFIVTPAETVSVVIVVCSVLVYVAWYVYFTKSKRVAVYMHPEQYQRLQPPPYGQPPMYGAPMPPMPPNASNVPPVPPAMAAGTPPAAPESTSQAAVRVCARCGRQAPPDTRFCGGCGNPLL